jgi:HAD superfamily phosphoserine phosphatase-like hydrolase
MTNTEVQIEPSAAAEPRALPLRRWLPDVHAALIDMLTEAPDGALAAFDWDDTVIENDLGVTFLARMDATYGTDWFLQYQRQHAAEGPYAAFLQLTRRLAGLTPARVAELARWHVDAALASGEVHFREELVDLIRQMLTRGWRVVVVTASPAAVVREMAERIGIGPEMVIGMELELEPAGVLSDRIVQPAPLREGKAAALLARFGHPPWFAAGDSRSDVAMLTSARCSLLIQSVDAGLLTEAQARRWWVQTGWTPLTSAADAPHVPAEAAPEHGHPRTHA